MTQTNETRTGSLDWNKGEGLLPAIVQNANDGRVLMLGFVNREALEATLSTRRVTFFSRARQRLWTKGETSGHYLELVNHAIDCDGDTLLFLAIPHGPTCHTGTLSCFGDDIEPESIDFAFLSRLEAVIAQRLAERPEGSYTAKLWAQGPTRMAQKVGEEGVEVALAAVTRDDKELIGESADLLFHLTLLLKSRNLKLAHVVDELAKRHAAKS